MKRVEDMTLEELWQLFPVILSPHDPRRSEWAAEEIFFLKNILGPLAVRISHIGSTAIPGIMAKPIVDILVETGDSDNFPEIKTKITGAGHLTMNESTRRMSFTRGYTPSGYAEKVFHVHVHVAGDNDEIYFRDYLVAHPEIAREYEALKLSLWKLYEHDRDSYTEAKTGFVRCYTAIAKAESKEL